MSADCSCRCHVDPLYLRGTTGHDEHMVPCCLPCERCGRRVQWWAYMAHLGECGQGAAPPPPKPLMEYPVCPCGAYLLDSWLHCPVCGGRVRLNLTMTM